MRGRTLHDIKHDYFDEIDTSMKAYLLGFFIADGTIEVNQTGRYCIRFVQKQSDNTILYWIKDEISPSSFMGTIIRGSRVYNRISITSTEIGNALIAMGLNPRKTYEDFKLPTINEALQRDLIRGYFDGDGTAGAYIGYKSVVRQVSITSNSITILKDVNQILKVNGVKADARVSAKYYQLAIQDYQAWYKYIYPGITAFPRKQEAAALCTLTSSEIRRVKSSDPCNA